MNDDAHGFRDRMACLADESRFRIVLALAASEQCVSGLARAIGLSQSCTTRHLQSLARRGLVQGTRCGRQVVFSLRLDTPEINWVLQSGPAAGREDRAKHGVASEERRPVGSSSAASSKPVGVTTPGSSPDTDEVVSKEPHAAIIQLEHGEASDADGDLNTGPIGPRGYARSDLEDYLL